jgi:hypothetical protein
MPGEEDKKSTSKSSLDTDSRGKRYKDDILVYDPPL